MNNVGKTWNIALAAFGAITGYAFGGWTVLLQILVALAVADYLTGFGASWVEGKLSSKVGTRGIPKKILIFVMVAVCHLIDRLIGNGDVFRDAAIFFYAGNELLSIVENCARAGLPVPAVLQKAIQVIKERGGENK